MLPFYTELEHSIEAECSLTIPETENLLSLVDQDVARIGKYGMETPRTLLSLRGKLLSQKHKLSVKFLKESNKIHRRGIEEQRQQSH